MSASPGAAPGITMPQPGGSGLSEGSSTITVQSLNGFSGIVDLSTSCCVEAIRNRTINFAGTGNIVAFALAAGKTYVSVPANGSATAIASISIPAFPLGNYTQVPFGKYILTINGQQRNGTLQASTSVGFRVLPASEPHTTCRPSTLQSMALMPALEAEMANTEKATPLNPIVIAVISQTPPDVWRMSITSDPGLGPFDSIVELENDMGWEKEITTSGCSSFAKNKVVQGGGKMDYIHIIQSQDRTIVLRKPVCDVPLCVTTHMEDVIVFPETLFWSVFGGKRVRFVWVKD